MRVRQSSNKSSQGNRGDELEQGGMTPRGLSVGAFIPTQPSSVMDPEEIEDRIQIMTQRRLLGLNLWNGLPEEHVCMSRVRPVADFINLGYDEDSDVEEFDDEFDDDELDPDDEFDDEEFDEDYDGELDDEDDDDDSFEDDDVIDDDEPDNEFDEMSASQKSGDV